MIDKLPKIIKTETLLSLFPFYISWNEKSEIISIGPSVKKSCPELEAGKLISDFFECTAPNNGFDFNRAGSFKNNLYILKNHKTQTIFRGNIIFLDQETIATLLLTPWISQPEDLINLNLTLNDFSAHDQTLDILQLMQTHRITISDMNKLNEALLTEKKALKEQRDELDWIYQNAPIGLAVFDIDGRYIHINEYLAKINGLAAHEHIGKNIHDILPLVSARFDQAKEAINLTRTPLLNQEITFSISEGTTLTRHFNENWYPVFNTEEQIAGFGVLVEETTDKKSAAALIAADNRKNQFLATLSHELRNPAATIGMSIEILNEKIKEIDDEEHSIFPFIERADRQLKHLNRLLDDLLEVSRITQGKIELKLEIIDISEIIRRALDLSIQKIQQFNHELQIDWPKSEFLVFGDPERLTQIFSNIIDNASKYTNSNGKIEISIVSDKANAIVSIKDNGIGVKPENLSNIFEMFYQIKNSEEKRGLGLGIGLALVRQLVYLHSGSISVSSDGDNKGTTFTIKLPLYQ